MEGVQQPLHLKHVKRASQHQWCEGMLGNQVPTAIQSTRAEERCQGLRFACFDVSDRHKLVVVRLST